MKSIITEAVDKKMKAYINLCPYEISGMGKVERDTAGNFIVTDIRILEQEVNGASSDMDTAALAKFQVELIRAGENPVEWVCWWHSHATMDVFWSAKDNTCINNSTELPYMLSIVSNKKGAILSRVDVYNPVRMTANLETEIQATKDTALYQIVQGDIDAKVRTQKTYVATPRNKFGFAYDDEYYAPHNKKQLPFPALSKKAQKKEAKRKAKIAAQLESFEHGKSTIVDIEDGEGSARFSVTEFYNQRDALIEELVDSRLERNSDNEAIALQLLEDLANNAPQYGLDREIVTAFYSKENYITSTYDNTQEADRDF